MPAVVLGVKNLLPDMIKGLRDRLDRLERMVSLSLNGDGNAIAPGRFAQMRWVAAGSAGETFVGLAGSPVVNSEIVTVDGVVKDPYLDYTISGTTLFPNWVTAFGEVVLMFYAY